MTTPARQDFVIRANTHWERIWQIKSNGVPLDISSYDFRMELKYERGLDSRTFLSLSVGDGITLIDASQGQFKITIEPQTAITQRKVFQYDLLVTIAGYNYVWVEGLIAFEPGVTY